MATTQDRDIRFASRFNPGELNRDLIDTVKRLPEGDKSEHMLGLLIGKIRGISFRNNPNDPTQASIALLGVFEGIPYAEDKPIIQAPMCFLPKAVHDLIAEAVSQGLPRPDKMPGRGKPQNHRIDQEVPVKLEIGVRRSSSPIGFEFIINNKAGKTGMSAVDVLADLRDGIEAPKAKALPPPAKGKKMTKRGVQKI